MFRGNMCPLSGERTVFMRQLVLVILYRWLSCMQGGIKKKNKPTVHRFKNQLTSWNIFSTGKWIIEEMLTNSTHFIKFTDVLHCSLKQATEPYLTHILEAKILITFLNYVGEKFLFNLFHCGSYTRVSMAWDACSNGYRMYYSLRP
jgi:hypothetical protein